MSALPAHVSFPDGPAGLACPACGGGETAAFYAVRGVPAHSCVLLEDAEAARAFPTGDLELAHCPACGFVFNAAFDPEHLDYSEDYEETQGCSPTFSRWLEGIVSGLVERTGLEGGTVVEIGCGRGDFLALLCERARARGIGIDPSATAGRVERSAGLGLEFLREEYGPQHARFEADLFACRHTLEHLADVRGVARLLREDVGDRASRVFLEVPDVLRVLQEGAFWDLYYEHCSYFSAGSLARLFRGAGFEVEALELEYGGQYVQLLAHAGGGGPSAGLEDDLASLERAVATFRRTCRASLERWHAVLEATRAAGESLVLWGSGSKATGFLTTLGARDSVRAVVDINPAKHGRFVAGSGHPIVAPDQLPSLAPDHVVVMNPVYEEEISADLRRLGVEANVLAGR